MQASYAVAFSELDTFRAQLLEIECAYCVSTEVQSEGRLDNYRLSRERYAAR